MSRSIEITSGTTTTARARTAASAPAVLAQLASIVGEEHLVVDPTKVEPYAQDAIKEKFPPEAVLFPSTAEEVARILRLANEARFPVTARGLS
jgi:glycolate oxidase